MGKIITGLMTIVAVLAMALSLMLLIGGITLIATNPTGVAVIPGSLAVMFGAYGASGMTCSIKEDLS